MIVTLSSLLAFDPRSRPRYPRQRFRCPELACSGKAERSLSVDLSEGVWRCWRCGASGQFGHESRDPIQQLRAVAVCKPTMDWRERYQKSGVGPLAGTPGQKYLEKRGVPLEAAQQCGIEFGRCFYKRASVMFPIRSQTGELVAVQGRAVVGPTKLTIGPKKDGVFETPGWRRYERIAITEAPIDAVSLFLLGWPAIAVCGSGLPEWLPNAMAGKVALIASDNDEQGERDFDTWGEILEPTTKWIERLAPPERFNDWNDYLRETPP